MLRYLTAALCALVCVSSPALGMQKGVHKDPRIGFEIRVPKDWNQIPIRSDEVWIVAEYVSEKKDRVVDDLTGASLVHNPNLRAIAFIDEIINRSSEDNDDDEKKDEGATKKEEGKSESRLAYRGPIYRNYKEYMKATFPGGYFIEDESTVEVRGMTAERYVIKVEADVNYSEKRIETWVFDTELADVAIQVEVQKASYDDHKSTIQKTLKSFKVIERTEGLNLAASTGNSFASSIAIGMLTPEARKKRRIEMQKSEWQDMTRNLPDGWTAKEIKGAMVLNNSDEKHAKKVVAHVQAIMSWLEDTFPEIGAGEHARTPIIQICKDADEERAFRSGSGGTSVAGTKLVTHKGNRSADFTWEYIGKRTLQLWFLDRDADIWISMPAWLDSGLDEMIGAATPKGSKLKFGDGYVERALKPRLNNDGEPIPIRELMMFTDAELAASMRSDDPRPWLQSVALARFLLDGPGAKSKKTKNILPDYLRNLDMVVKEIRAEEAERDEIPKPTNEEEEEAYMKERQKRARAMEKRILQETLDRTFEGWSDGDWAALDRAYQREL